ncbi:MAG TPA: prepilin-type N-terminal cleavage/methylation domain-containing protein [bacterium]|nr:prepilin-type N-terminal cleavage/methylation domain-containing protein [bacterium]HQO36741.1 prepilin-type N-terminal cleavage/methylation domain-containing protein [bacterium]HQQ00148.1 prepilin-type N-terminal cleavage/methylation domain-containing protein [bacterium]
MRRPAFTLIELLIVVAIIGILAAIAVPNFMNARVKAKIARVLANMKTTTQALELYYLDNHSYTRWAREDVGWDGYAQLTTPVAYIQGFSVVENAFYPAFEEMLGNTTETDRYFELGTFKSSSGRSYTIMVPNDTWVLEAWGPTMQDPYNSAAFPEGPGSSAIYHQSNGLTSGGGFFRVGGVKLPEWARSLSSNY